MMHACRHHGKEQRRRNKAGNDPDSHAFGHAQPAHDPHNPARNIAQRGHDDQNIRNGAKQEGEHRRKDNIEALRHPGPDLLLNDGKQEDSRDDGQHAAFSGTENGTQGAAFVEKPQEQGNLIDAFQGRDHPEHAAEDGGRAEALRRPVARPGRNIGHEGGVDQGQQPIQDAPSPAALVTGDGLRDQGGQAGAQPRGDNAGNQRHKDFTEGFEPAPQGAVFLAASQLFLVLLPGRRLPAGGGRKPRRAALGGVFRRLARPDHNLIVSGPVMNQPKHICSGAKRRFIHEDLVLHRDPQAGHTIGDGYDIAAPAETADQQIRFCPDIVLRFFLHAVHISFPEIRDPGAACRLKRRYPAFSFSENYTIFCRKKERWKTFLPPAHEIEKTPGGGTILRPAPLETRDKPRSFQFGCAPSRYT